MWQQEVNRTVLGSVNVAPRTALARLATLVSRQAAVAVSKESAAKDVRLKRKSTPKVSIAFSGGVRELGSLRWWLFMSCTAAPALEMYMLLPAAAAMYVILLFCPFDRFQV
jgi:hypothetical protein